MQPPVSSQLQTTFFRMPQATSSRYELPQSQRHQTQQQSSMPFRTQYKQSQAQQLASQQKESESQEVREREEGNLNYMPALAKLKLEADKIRKWKTATQLELKRKESQLKEAVEQIRSQQSDLTGLRVENEGLKTRLEDEVASQKEIHQRIMVTRGLCSTLREHLEHSDQALAQSKADHTHNMELDRLRMEQYQALAGRFSQLEKEHCEVQRSLEEALIKERERSDQRAIECGHLQEEISAAKAEVSSLTTVVADIRGSLGAEEERRKQAEEMASSLGQELGAVRTHSESLERSIASLNGELTSLKAQHSETVSSLHHQLQAMEQSHAQLTAACNQHRGTISTLRTQLESANRDQVSLENAVSSLRDQLSTVEGEKAEVVSSLSSQLKEQEQQHAQSTGSLQQTIDSLQVTITSQKAQLSEVQARNADKDEKIKQLISSMGEKETLCCEIETEREALRMKVQEVERKLEEGRVQRGRERAEVETTMETLRSEMASLNQQLQDHHKTEGERVTQLVSEKRTLEETVAELRERVAHGTQQVELEQQKAQCDLEEVRREWQEEVQRCRKEAEAAQHCQEEDKKSFDTQVTELCAMLEKYRSENQKIVQQKDLQIHSLQTSLADQDKAKVSLEEMAHLQQEEVGRLREEVRERTEEVRLKGREVAEIEQQLKERERQLGEREEEVRRMEQDRQRREESMREEVREKELEIKELLKAVEHLKSKSKTCTPQSTTHHLPTSTPHRSHTSTPHSPAPSPHPSPTTQPPSPHTPQVPVVSSMVPLSAPVHTSSLHRHTPAVRELRPQESLHSYHPRSLSTPRSTPRLTARHFHTLTPSRADSTRTRTMKKPYHHEEEEEEEGEEVVDGKEEEGQVEYHYDHEDPQELVFRRPRPMPSTLMRRSSSSSSSSSSTTTRAISMGGSRRHTSSHTSAVSPATRVRDSHGRLPHSHTRAASRVGGERGVGRGGRGRKAGAERKRGQRGGGGGERKQAGTAWFDLDSVFGFGPED